MAFRVIGPMAIVKVSSGPDLWLSHGDQLPDSADAEHVKHLVRMGLVKPDQGSAGDGDAKPDQEPVKRGPGRPRKSDS